MHPLKVLRKASLITLAAGLAPFVFFGLLFLMVLGVASMAFFPLFFAFIGWMQLNKWARRAEREARESQILEARVVREAPAPAFPPEAYTPPVHFDLLLTAKGEIGRMRGAASAIADGAIARQALAVAERADQVLDLVVKEPAKLGLARRFFASHLPRAADIAEGAHKLGQNAGDEARRTRLLDVLYRLEDAMASTSNDLSAGERARLDVDLTLLSADLKEKRPA